MNENETKTGSDKLIERIVDALNTDTSPEWNPAPSWADYVLTWEGLRCLANDLMGRRPYDGRDPLADADRNTTLAKALKAEGYIVLSPDRTDTIRRGEAHYGPLCPRHEAQFKYQARRVGTVPGRDGCTICGYRSLGGMEDVDIYVW